MAPAYCRGSGFRIAEAIRGHGCLFLSLGGEPIRQQRLPPHTNIRTAWREDMPNVGYSVRSCRFRISQFFYRFWILVEHKIYADGEYKRWQAEHISPSFQRTSPSKPEPLMVGSPIGEWFLLYRD